MGELGEYIPGKWAVDGEWGVDVIKMRTDDLIIRGTLELPLTCIETVEVESPKNPFTKEYVGFKALRDPSGLIQYYKSHGRRVPLGIE